jgi:hypothetical protein
MGRYKRLKRCDVYGGYSGTIESHSPTLSCYWRLDLSDFKRDSSVSDPDVGGQNESSHNRHPFSHLCAPCPWLPSPCSSLSNAGPSCLTERPSRADWPCWAKYIALGLLALAVPSVMSQLSSYS